MNSTSLVWRVDVGDDIYWEGVTGIERQVFGSFVRLTFNDCDGDPVEVITQDTVTIYKVEP